MGQLEIFGNNQGLYLDQIGMGDEGELAFGEANNDIFDGLEKNEEETGIEEHLGLIESNKVRERDSTWSESIDTTVDDNNTSPL